VPEKESNEILGVVGDVREGSPEKAAKPTVYYPHVRSRSSR
jgi:hypothetical protein